MSVNKLLQKAERLLKTNRVMRLTGDMYNVVGNHGTYLVSILNDGRLSCNCPGFQRKKMCSHIMAIFLMRNRGNIRQLLTYG